MPMVKIYPNGLTMSHPHGNGKPPETKRGKVAGWSSQAAARHVAWLMSVDASALEGRALVGYTLTVRDTPRSAADFHRMRRTWLKRAERQLGPGLLWCWVMEWQQRGAPHLHGMLAFDPVHADTVRRLVYLDWPEVAGGLTSSSGQHVTPVSDERGWMAYLAKHIGRGHGHLQREGMPPGWESSGRLWGHSAAWPTSEAVYQLDRPSWYQLRRLVHRWALADARGERDPQQRARRLAYLRRRRRLSAESSPWVGLREWAPPAVADQLLRWVVSTGADVVDRDTGELL